MIKSNIPHLPEPVATDEGSTDDHLQQHAAPVRISKLHHGCYLAQWCPRHVGSHWFNGVMRIERHSRGITASGDLYVKQAFETSSPPFAQTPEPDPCAGIPIFPRNNYRCYLRVTQMNESDSAPDTFTLRMGRYSFNTLYNIWSFDGDFNAVMTFKGTPVSYPSGATYLEGAIRNSSETVVGTLKLGWVSKYLRKATLEIDRVPKSEYPADNGAGVNWKDVYDSVDWDVNVYESDTNLEEPTGESWSTAELHAAMLDRRDSSDVDNEWRYHLLCVRHIEGGALGVMYDRQSADSNRIPREGAAVSSHIVFPAGSSKWGPVAGQRMGTTPEYFRTAVHEIGHAMGLQHNDVDNAFMNSTGSIPNTPGYPANIPWTFNSADEARLRHMPDPWVRPGMILFNQPYRSAPFTQRDLFEVSDSHHFEVKAQLSTVPIGAPVRIGLTLRNKTDALLVVPSSLSLKSGHVRGRVIGPGGSSKRFRSIMGCVDTHKRQTIEPGAEIRHDLTLLRGYDGPLFGAPGLYQIKVDVAWFEDNTPICVRGSAAVIVKPATTESHAAAALKTLSTPDLLLTIALGGDHLKAGVEALQVALADETLNPHYAVIEAKRIGRSFRTQHGDASAALKLLEKNTVMSPTEVSHVAALLEGFAKPYSSAIEAMKKSAMGDKSAEEMVNKLVSGT